MYHVSHKGQGVSSFRDPRTKSLLQIMIPLGEVIKLAWDRELRFSFVMQPEMESPCNPWVDQQHGYRCKRFPRIACLFSCFSFLFQS